MDSGDQPTCSKYWREPAPEPDENEPEPENPDPADSDGEESQELNGWQLKLPATILRETGDVLQLPELRVLRLVCRSWTQTLDTKFLEHARAFAAGATHYQWEPIHYSHALYAPRIFPRIFHCGAHHPMTDKIYMFGGNGPQRVRDAYDFDAHYNDLWTYDMRHKKWERILVPGTPYPVPKSRSTLVAWREYLVLFGGFRRPNRRTRVGVGAAEFPERVIQNPGDEEDTSYEDWREHGTLPNEVHYYNVKKNVWELATPIRRENAGPAAAAAHFLLGLHDHSATIVGEKWMVVAGGLRSTPWEESVFINMGVFIFDLEEKVWHRAMQPPNSRDEQDEGPSVIEAARGTLALIRPGRLLFHPCFPIRMPRRPPAAPGRNGRRRSHRLLPMQALMARQRDELRCYYLDYDKDDVLGGLWRWSPVPVVSPYILRQTGPLAPPVVVISENRVRLVNAVIEQRRTRRDSDLDTYSGLKSFSTAIKCAIENRLANCTPPVFYESLVGAPFEFELDCYDFYKHIDSLESGRDALKLCVSVLQGKSGHIGDYKILTRALDSRYTHVFTRGVINFIEETTIGMLPTKGGGKSPHFATTEKTLQLVRQSSRRVIKLLQADLTTLDERNLPQLTWTETAERPAYEEHPVPSTGLLMVQADGSIFVTGGESTPDDDGLIDTSIGGGTWVANPVK